MFTAITSHLGGGQRGVVDLSNLDVSFCPHSETMPSFLMEFPVCENYCDAYSRGFVCHTSNRLFNLSSELLLFSSGFFRTQVYVTAPTNAIDKKIIIIFESRVVQTLKWLFTSQGEGRGENQGCLHLFTVVVLELLSRDSAFLHHSSSFK